MNRFPTLLHREWMQHRRGWLLLAVIPAVLALLAVPFGQIRIEGFVGAPMLAAIAITIYLMALLALALAAMLIQAPGMARRDQQDRSIEFWLSLPTSHWQSVSATLLMHLLLMPLLVLAISVLAAQLIAPLLVVNVLGVQALGEFTATEWVIFSAAGVLRQLLGLLFAVLWLSPLIMLAMAASAWLKGWGVPALVAGLVILGLLLQQLTGHTLVWQVLGFWWAQAKVAALPLLRGGIPFESLAGSDAAMGWFRDWLLHDTAQLLRDAVHPGMAGGLLVAAGGFVLLIWRRSRPGN
ncbi:hypothetical protein [Piscinibacter sakaiensis]|uniref:hypothetical protein n=1 Tax=Piscinibacter sakaiensis TaxID=1547922 RepID=UPI003AAA6721